MERTSAEIYTGAIWTTASCSELHFKATEASSHHTDGIIHTAGWIKVDTTPPAVNLIRRADIRDLSEQSKITSALQSFRTSPCRLLFSILPFWAVRNNLGSFFIDLGCQVVFDMSHISNLVLHHCRKKKSQVRVTKSVKTLRIQIKTSLLKDDSCSYRGGCQQTCWVWRSLTAAWPWWRSSGSWGQR